MIVGAHGTTNGHFQERRAYLFRGGSPAPATTASWQVESNQPDAQLGSSVAGAGDVNGDGFADVIVGSLYFDTPTPNAGRAWVYLGGPLPGGLSTTTTWFASGGLAGAAFGNAVSSAGRVYVYNGSATGVSPTAARVVAGEGGGAGLGCGICFWDDGAADEGRALLYPGSTDPPTYTFRRVADLFFDREFVNVFLNERGDVGYQIREGSGTSYSLFSCATAPRRSWPAASSAARRATP